MKKKIRYMILLILCMVGVGLTAPGNAVQAASAGADGARGRWISQNGKNYFRNGDGTLSKGWLRRSGYKYYLDKRSGERVTGWYNIDGKRYYFQPQNGRAVTGWFTVNGEDYYAFSNGIIKTGWLDDQGDRYYLHKDKKGAMQKGWTKIEGKRYFFYPDGRLAVKTWLDERHYVDNEGVLRPDVVKKKKNTFRWPLDRAWDKISSPFGYRGPMSVGTSDHNGIDIPAPTDTPIYAGKSGVIIKREYNDSEGYHIEIDHKNGLVSEYMHMVRFEPGLQAGSEVKRGQLIGYVGSTGWSTGAHLHFGVKMNGERIDPLGYVCQP